MTTTAAKCSPAKGSGVAVLEVGFDEPQRRVGGEIGQPRQVTIDGDDRMTQAEEQPGVPSAAGADVEHRSARVNVGAEAHHPLRRSTHGAISYHTQICASVPSGTEFQFDG